MPFIKEKLPYPIVRYPPMGGIFLCFKKTIDSPPSYCSCFAEAIENFILLKLKYPNNCTYPDPAKNFILDSFNFQSDFVKELIINDVPQDISILNYINFENKLCHECNNLLPSHISSVNNKGGAGFLQKYRWYVDKKMLEYGIHPTGRHFLTKKCPQEISDIYGDEYQILIKKMVYYGNLKDYANHNKVNDQLNKIAKKVSRVVENEVRENFGFKIIGESWISETVLYYMVKNLFPGKTVLRHYRPVFLDKLELDIFIKEYHLGIEYQGIQHFKPIKHWGGKKALEKTKYRDKKKKDLCDKHGVELLYFYYNEQLSEEYVKAQIGKALDN